MSPLSRAGTAFLSPSPQLINSSSFCPSRAQRQRASSQSPRRIVRAIAADRTEKRPLRALSSPRQRFYDFSSHVVRSLRATHCRVLTAELADEVERAVKAKSSSLAELAASLSLCEPTRASHGDTGWIDPADHPFNSNDEYADVEPHDVPPVTAELLDLLLKARPRALTVARVSYGWEVFEVTDVRHALTPTFVGATRRPGHPIAGRMRRVVGKPPRIVPRSYHIDTLGCQMNASDSERMAASLEAAGYSAAPDEKRAAVYILNTCALREHAQDKVYSYLGPHARRKWAAPDAVTLVVAGCVAQQEAERLLVDVPELDIVMGPQYANRADEVLAEFALRQAQVVAVDPVHIHEDISRPKRGASVTAWVNIIYGCLERCSYCVVPHTRGLEQSRSPDAIREEVERLVADGFREVVLLGQNVDAYGRDLHPRRTLADLLHHIHDVDGLLRIRFTTGHPRYISQNLLNAVRDLPKVMEHFHVPPQSGDTDVLREMGRGYSRERYIDIARRIRESMPDASICADMIVGFPGETDAAFQNSVSMADEVVFDANMVRAYSARPNTPAALRDDQVDEAVKKERLAIMNRKMKEHALVRSQRYMDRVVEVLVEGRNPKVESEMMGRERTNRIVFFEGAEDLVGQLVEVHVSEAFTFSLRGHIVRVLT